MKFTAPAGWASAAGPAPSIIAAEAAPAAAVRRLNDLAGEVILGVPWQS